jgi:hypothetical protein
MTQQERQDWRWLICLANGKYWSPNRREMKKIVEAGYKPVETVVSKNEAFARGRELALKGAGKFGEMLRKSLMMPSEEKIPTHKQVIRSLRQNFIQHRDDYSVDLSDIAATDG